MSNKNAVAGIVRIFTISGLLLCSAGFGAPAQAQGAAPDLRSALEQYCSASDAECVAYQVPAPADAGAGAIVTFNQYGEEAVRAPNSACLKVDLLAPEAAPAPALGEFVFSPGDPSARGIAKQAAPGLDLESAYLDARVARITYELTGVFQQGISASAAEDAFRAIPEADGCRAALLAPGALVVRWQLGARGVRYVFRTEAGEPIALDESLLTLIGLDEAGRRELTGAAALDLKGAVLLAYRAWRPDIDAGLFNEDVHLGAANGQAIARARQRAAAVPRQGALPDFFWPPPLPSSSVALSRARFPGAQTLGGVDARISSALRQAEYSQWSYYRAPGGFAIVARLERVRDDARPARRDERFLPPGAGEANNPLAFIHNLFFAPPGRYRQVIFVISDKPFEPNPQRPTPGQALTSLENGTLALPPFVQALPLGAHRVTALVYEFKKQGRQSAHLQRPGEWMATVHLERARLLEFLPEQH